MKYLYVCASMLFLKIVEAFKPYITKYYTFFNENAFSYSCSNIIRTFSGLLPKLPSTLFRQNNQVTTIPIDCDVDNKNCKKEIIIPGYMEHSPNIAALKNHNNKHKI